MRIDEVIVNEFGLDDIKKGYAGVKQGIKNFGNKRIQKKQIKQAKPLAKQISNEFIKWKARRFPQADVTVTLGKELAGFLKDQYQITNPLAQGFNSIAPLLKGSRTLTPAQMDQVFMAIVYKGMNDDAAGSGAGTPDQGSPANSYLQNALDKLDPELQQQALTYLRSKVK